jgi:hypothetical protein
MGFGTWLVRSSNSREGNQQLFLATCDGEACSPRSDPCVMRVSAAGKVKETHDVGEAQEETSFAGADSEEAS